VGTADIPAKGMYEYLIQILSDISEAVHDGDRLAGQSWQELAAWQELSGVKLTSSESLIIHKLSRHYASMYNSFNGKSAASPTSEAPTSESVAGRFKTLFSMMRGNKND